MKKFLIIVSFVLAGIGYSYSQELNANVKINSDKIQGVDKNVFTNLENSIRQLLNEYRWTNIVFSQNEKIECTFTFTIESVPQENSYIGKLQINSRRPVYNTVYTTPTFMYEDADIEFEYMQGDNLEFNETMITNNLVAIVGYYAYIILGIDSDSFALNGGKRYFEKAMEIVNAAQSLSDKGWAAFENDKNRYALAYVLTEESTSRFHDMWYNYHRLGLDEMANNLVRGRDRIKESLKDLEAVNSARPFSAIILFYGDTKLNELVDIYSDVSAEEKKEAYEVLRKIYPTKSSILESIRK